MLNNLSTVLSGAFDLTSTTASTTITTSTFLKCTLFSLILGAVIAFAFSAGQRKSKSFTTCVALLPVIVQVVIMLVNGNLGTGVAVMGAFSLVRFRSAPGNAKDILGIFLAMSVGLATGTDHILLAVIFTAIVCICNIVYTLIPFGDDSSNDKILTIVIPESLDYGDVFDDIFEKYTRSVKLTTVKTTNMGSLFKLTYDITLKKGVSEKKLIDDLRVRNGNLEIICSRRVMDPDQL